MTATDRPLVALSVSDGPDLARFGYLERHLRQVLAEVLIGLLRADCRVGYGGDLRRDGYTRDLFEALTAAYQRNQLAPTARPAIVHYFPFSSWQEADTEELLRHLQAVGGVAETRFLDAGGGYDAVFWTDDGLRQVLPDGETAGLTQGDLIRLLQRLREARVSETAARALTAMRETMARETVLRVVASGKVAGYQGRMPGIVEEALRHAEAGRLVVPLGAFGGAARAVAVALRLLPAAARVPYAETGQGYEEALRVLAEFAGRQQDLAARLAVRPALERLATADEPTAIAAGVVRLARLAAETGQAHRTPG
ncbi:MAG: hypothetical protein EA405_13795 [Rhodospirillales bacterium]|nr:MAG: hypothetical protein EA405_13795 [Rhodospirillales bacterium]